MFVILFYLLDFCLCIKNQVVSRLQRFVGSLDLKFPIVHKDSSLSCLLDKVLTGSYLPSLPMVLSPILLLLI